MVQWLIEFMRNRERDRVRAVEVTRESSERELRDALAHCDAFVAEAQAIGDGLVLGRALTSADDEITLRLPWDEYAPLLVQGTPGAGKTRFVLSVLCQLVASGHPAGLIDCKGDAFQAAVPWMAALGQMMEAERRAALLRRLVVVNPFGDDLVPLNVCRVIPGSTPEFQAYEVVVALSRLFDDSLSLHGENILRHLILLCMEANLTLVEAPLVLQDEVLRQLLARESSNPALKEFFLGAYGAIPQVSKDALLNRLQALLLPQAVRLMLGANDLVDLRGILEGGDPLLAFLGKGPGVSEEQVDVLASIFIQLLFQATYSRGVGARRPYFMALDDFHHVLEAPALTRRFESALSATRSFGLMLALVHQNFSQIPAALREIILTTSDLAFLFRTNARNAGFFGNCLPEGDPELFRRAWARGKDGPSRDEIRRFQLNALQGLPNRQCYLYDRRKPHRAVRLRVPHVPEPHEAARMERAELEELIRREGWDRGRAAVPRVELQGQIEARHRRLREFVRPQIRVSTPPGEGEDAAPREKAKRERPNLG